MGYKKLSRLLSLAIKKVKKFYIFLIKLTVDSESKIAK